jgi:hypothetical protein
MDNATPAVNLWRDQPRSLAHPSWRNPIGPEFASPRLLDSLPNRGPASAEPSRRPRTRGPGAAPSWLRPHPQPSPKAQWSVAGAIGSALPFPLAGSGDTLLP